MPPPCPGTAGVSPAFPLPALRSKESGRDARGPRVERGGCAAGSLGRSALSRGMEHLGGKHIICHVSDIRHVGDLWRLKADGSATSRTAQNAMEFAPRIGIPGSAG